MNKEEAKQKLHNLAFAKSDTKPDDLKLADVMQIVNQIYEPQKPVVPQFVADWIEVCKENLAIGLHTALNPDFVKQYNKSNELITWVRKHKNQETFAKAWIFGYEVEKEAKYMVKVKATKQYLCNDELGPHFSPSFRSNFTKTNLKELGFGWVFDCEGVEVEEVE